MKVEVTSTDTIKPSSPTPDHLRRLQFSLLDQISNPVFMPFILFYSMKCDAKADTVEISSWLKKTLSKTLVQFYPLAGRVKDNLFVDCTDEGVPYMEARVNCRLAEFICHPDPMELNKFLPCELHNVGNLVMAIQVNIFDCGGMAIAVCISHKVADALAMIMFFNGWAAVARGDTDMLRPQFGLSNLFPPVDLSGFQPSTGVIKENVVTKSFVFDASKLAILRARYSDSTSLELAIRPTRAEALSAFIWSRFVAATQGTTDSERVHTVLQAVNLRPRMDPPLPENYFGNISRIAVVTPNMDSAKEGHFGSLVEQMRDEIRKIDGDYIRKLQNGREHVNYLKKRSERFTKGEIVSFSFSSLCRFPVYEADFGWGKPLWVAFANLTFKNLVIFMDSRSDGGIEAWVNLKKEDMAKFQGDKELLSFASPLTSKL